VEYAMTEDFNDVIGTTLPHSEFGDPECCGCFNAVIRGDVASITCNECNVVLKTVPTADAQHALHEMELSLDMTIENCPHCGAVNLFPGFSEMMAFICSKCGEPVTVSRAHT
jgi:RNase P subunit RPR2